MWKAESNHIVCCRQLSAYFARFESRLTPANARHVQLLLRVVSALQRALEPPLQQQEEEQGAEADGDQRRGRGGAAGTAKQQQPGPEAEGAGGGGCLAVLDFLVGCHLDHINLFPLLRWVRESKLVMKVREGATICERAGYVWLVRPSRRAASTRQGL